LEREWAEETGISVRAGRLLDAWVYRVAGVDVLIVAHAVSAGQIPDAVVSPEGSPLAWFGLNDIERLSMSEGYKTAIRMCAASSA
jgi:8-oxo-dGTP pyrophosphatase MutT (NUDIX family)